MPFSPSPEPSSDPLAFLPPPSESTSIDSIVATMSDDHASLRASTPTKSTSQMLKASADTASVSGVSFAALASKAPSELASNTAINTLLASAMFSNGSNDWPVVDIWYDLDMVSEVRDPELFMKECDMINQ